MGEALLAGLHAARRVGTVVIVPDPYAAEGEIEIPAPPDKPLTAIADDLFRRHRRAQRGVVAARNRLASLETKRTRLEALVPDQEAARDDAGADALEASMRALGLPVGLVRPTRVAREAARTAAPRLAGVRIATSVEGWTILIGRTGKDNDRLTFKIAGADDFWLHAAGTAGAHVVIRNPDRAGSPPPATLAEAAAFAVWFSDAREQGAADVHWTKRKNVHRVRGAASGKVVLKRFDTVRARAKAPQEV